MCFKHVAHDGRFIKCSECEHVYHFGQLCFGISDSTYTGMYVAKFAKWRSLTCRSQESRSGSSFSSQDDASVVLSQLSRHTKESIETMLSLPGKVDGLMALKPTVEGLQSTVDKVQSTVEFLPSRYETSLVTVSKNARKMKQLETGSAVLGATVSEWFLAILKLRSA